MNKIVDSFIKFSNTMFLVVFGSLFIGGIIIKPMYHFDDYPYFTSNTLLDIACVFLVIGLISLIYKYKDVIEYKWNIKVVVIIFFVIALLYIFLVPLKPFSDMKHVSDGAIALSKGDFNALDQIEYFKTFKGNIKTSIFYAIPLVFMPKNILSMHFVNILLYFGCAFLSKQLAKQIGSKYPNVTFMLVLSFLPFVLYLNHIYYEFFVFFFSMLGFVLYFNRKKHLFSAVACFAIVIYLRRVGWIFLISILLFEIAEHVKSVKGSSKFPVIAFAILIPIILSTSLTQVTSFLFYDSKTSAYSFWDQFYIGINEEKIGFMNGEFSYDRSFNDVLDRIQEYGPVRVSKILVKKSLYAWMEGTYQVGRYALGANVENAADKFMYVTPVEKYLSYDTQFTRRLLTAICRAQYLVYFALMLMRAYRQRKCWNKEHTMQLVFLGTFVIMLIYELKSRYVMHCFPFLIIMAVQGLSEVSEYKKTEKLIIK